MGGAGDSSTVVPEACGPLWKQKQACIEAVGRLEALARVDADADDGQAAEGCQGYREQCRAMIQQMEARQQ